MTGIYQNKRSASCSRLLAALLAALLALALGGCKQDAAPSGTDTSEMPEIYHNADEPLASEVERALSVSTPLGELTLPEMWSGQVYADERSADGQYSVVFRADAAEQEVTLFTLFIGADGEGYLLGTAPDGAGETQSIRLQISEITPDDAWSEEETQRINLLQSGVNDLLEQIYALDGFTAGE